MHTAEFEVVSYEEGLSFAKEINAIFKIISVENGYGIDNLFIKIGKKILNPNLDFYQLLDEGDEYFLDKEIAYI